MQKKPPILIITQALDRQDPVLGFFHRWVEVFAQRFERVTVICLKQGDVALPANCTVYSLGKEQGSGSPWRYAWRFFKILWGASLSYKSVFVHMNEEYVLLAGWYWRLLGKRLLLWRNHPSGSWKTRFAAMWSHVIFYTSERSYTARFKKAVRMPVGIVLPDESLIPPASVQKRFLSLGRISPVKHVDLIVRSFSRAEISDATLTIVGDPIPRPIDITYAAELEKTVHDAQMRGEQIMRTPGIPPHEAEAYFFAHDLFVNATEPGSFDKTILEAAAHGCIPLVSQDLWSGTAYAALANELTFAFPDERSLAQTMQRAAQFSIERRQELRDQLRSFIHAEHSLEALLERLLSYV